MRTNDDEPTLEERKNYDPPITLVTTKPDAELAQEYKDKIIQAYQPLLNVLREIDKAGFSAQVNVGKNGLGIIEIQTMNIMKIYQLF